MFEVGFTEILVIAVLALIVLGPEKLPRVAAQLGRWMGRARAMARQFREQLEEEVTVSETHKAKATSSAGAASAAAAGATATDTAGESPTPPPMYTDSQSYTPPPEVSAAEAAAAETAHSDSTTAPQPEPEAPFYQPPAYANGGDTHTAEANGVHEQPSATQPSAVESPPSHPDDESPRKAGDFITTTHERGI
jgi:sec-independent protein translocase protein TatB